MLLGAVASWALGCRSPGTLGASPDVCEGDGDLHSNICTARSSPNHNSHAHWAMQAALARRAGRADVHAVDGDGPACQGCKRPAGLLCCATPCRGTLCVCGCCGGGSVDMSGTPNARAALTCHVGSQLSAPPQPTALCQDEHTFLVKPARAPLTTHWHADMVATRVCGVTHCRNF